MAMTLAHYLATAQERDAVANKNIEACRTCATPLQETIVGYRPTDDGTLCSDCYFDAISEKIDEHPIGRPIPAVAHLTTR